MKKIICIVVVVMVVALLLSSVFDYKTNSFGEAVKGLENSFGVISSVSEKAVELLQGVAAWPEQLQEHFTDKFGATDYNLPLYYRRLMGDTANNKSGLNIVSTLMGGQCPTSSFEYINMAEQIYNVMGKDFYDIIENQRYLLKEKTAKSLYYYDLYFVVSGYEFYASQGKKTPQDIKDAMFAAYCRIEGKNDGAGNKLLWRWNSSLREKYAIQYGEILTACEEDMLVWQAPWNNIAYYEFGVFVLPDEDGNYAESTPDTAFFNVKNYGN